MCWRCHTKDSLHDDIANEKPCNDAWIGLPYRMLRKFMIVRKYVMVHALTYLTNQTKWLVSHPLWSIVITGFTLVHNSSDKTKTKIWLVAVQVIKRDHIIYGIVIILSIWVVSLKQEQENKSRLGEYDVTTNGRRCVGGLVKSQSTHLDREK